ncbi:MAG: carbonic anhydrase [Ignavibacteriae bacterium]|nr:MAG: carbonic anhydrase [Ignavibacteriota bacterium]
MQNISSLKDIPVAYKNTPIESLIKYHNFGEKFTEYPNARLLVGMCMDNRKKLNIPENFAFVLRTGGVNLRANEFHISFAISVGKIKHIALIGHNNCGMVNLHTKKEQFITGLTNTCDWESNTAEEHFHSYAPILEISDSVDFTLNEVIRLRMKYPNIIIAPMMYIVEDRKLYFIDE